MAVYTVHEPPMKADQPQPDPERFVFVRDGFYFWAFLLAPFWMLWRRLWIVFVLYLIVVAALQIILATVNASTTVMVTASVLLSLLVGLEAATLRRFTWARRRWTSVGIVVGDDLETAERRFFDTWAKGDWAKGDWATNASIERARRPSAVATAFQPPPGSSHASSSHGASGVIGLFPEPGAQR
jgi:Protein of unknown function (DUF2628)